MAALGCLGILVILAPPICAQDPIFEPTPAALVSLWGATVVDGDREALPLSPQVGLRAEGTLEGRVWLGLDASLSFLRRPVGCVVVGECGTSESDVRESFLAHARFELDVGDARPYAGILVGEEEHSQRRWGFLSGARLPELLDDFDALVELRWHRGKESPNNVENRFEIRLGIGIG